MFFDQGFRIWSLRKFLGKIILQFSFLQIRLRLSVRRLGGDTFALRIAGATLTSLRIFLSSSSCWLGLRWKNLSSFSCGDCGGSAAGTSSAINQFYPVKR